MKRLSQEISLKGKCEEISLTEFRASPGAVLSMVELGKTFILTRNGQQIAVLSQVPGETLTLAVAADGKIKHKI
jgi:hypothetical protein